MKKKYFSVAEANEIVPRLEGVFGRVLRVRAQLRIASSQLQALGETLTEENLLRADGPSEVVSARGRARALVEMLNEELKGLEELGVQVKDLDIGLCDFVARREGRDVLLCWRLGEKRIGFWHELHTGVAGRQPIDVSMERIVH